MSAVNKEDLKAKIEQVLSELIHPDARYPLSELPIDVRVIKVDETKGEVELDLGICHFVEGTQLCQFLEKELKSRLPQIQHVSASIKEL